MSDIRHSLFLINLSFKFDLKILGKEPQFLDAPLKLLNPIWDSEEK